MNEHALLQRALFRMQLDADFAARVFARERAALESTGLSPAATAVLLAADVAGVRADREGARRAQFLRNVASEFPLVVALAPALEESFSVSPAFHEAIRRDQSLALAFATHAQPDLGADERLRALLELEQALARARRHPRERVELHAGELALSAEAELVELPAGTFADAEALRSALDGGLTLPAASARTSGGERETVLILRQPRTADQRLAEVEPERLEAPVARLLQRCRVAQDRAALLAFAASEGAAPEELLGFCAELLATGVLAGEVPFGAGIR